VQYGVAYNENKTIGRMALFSYHGGIPEPLPAALKGISADQLASMGYSGPFNAPRFDPRTQSAKWSGQEWIITDLLEEEIIKAQLERLLSRADWSGFSVAVMESAAYQKARLAAAVSLQVNVDCTELIAFLADARAGRPYIDGINACFASIDQEIILTEDDKTELYSLVQNFGLGAFLMIPNYTPTLNPMEE
jgi:hypothetical protein